MPIHNVFYQETFTSWPRFSCPSCEIGHIEIEGEPTVEESKDSIKLREEEFWTPDSIKGSFSARFKCRNDECGEFIFVCGSWDVFETIQEERLGTDEDFLSSYQPLYFKPALPVFRIPEQCPERVSQYIARAFSLLWADHGACANRLRVALEEMVDDLHVQGNGEGDQNTAVVAEDAKLNAKIRALENRKPELFTQLMALKFLGNFGSHNEPLALRRREIIGAFEHFERALNLAYAQNDRLLQNRAERIIENRGPER